MNEEPTQGDLKVHVDAGARTATVVVPFGIDSAALDPASIVQCARDRGVLVTDHVERRINDFVEQYQRDSSHREAVIAEASPPVSGRDGRIEWIDGFDPHEPCAVANCREEAAGAPDEKRDFYNICNYVKVEAGTHVAMLFGASDGQDGVDVRGAAIRATPGRRLELQIDPTLTVDDLGRVTAAISGVLQIQHGTLKVTRVLEVDAHVDFSTGNINCDGSVVVKEGVRDCFTVKATEDVTVHGLIEAATIMCGRNLVCRRGMAARDRGLLIVDGKAEIGFLNNVRGRIKHDLVVHNELMSSQIVVGGRLHCERGSIVGGTTVVTGAVRVGTLGADAGTPTTLILGVVPFLGAQLARLDDYDRLLRRQLRDLLNLLPALRERDGALVAPPQRQTERLTYEIRHHKEMIEACARKRRDVRRQLADQRAFDLSVARMIHPRVTLKVHDREVHFHEPLKGPVTIYWNESRQIKFRQGDGAVRDICEVALDHCKAA